MSLIYRAKTRKEERKEKWFKWDWLEIKKGKMVPKFGCKPVL